MIFTVELEFSNLAGALFGGYRERFIGVYWVTYIGVSLINYAL